MDVYQKITDRVVRELEQGVRPWMKPWSAGNGEGPIMRPLRGNGIPYQGINVLMLWSEAIEKGYANRATGCTTEARAPRKVMTTRRGGHIYITVGSDSTWNISNEAERTALRSVNQ
jgi:antirestriction protein ArdC